MKRQAVIDRRTAETSIKLVLAIDGQGETKLETGLPFFNHMLQLWCKHGFFDLDLQATGDLDVDGHHLVEDAGLCLGKALKEALGDKRGIKRYGQAVVPMDEALVTAVIDLSGRPWLHYDFKLTPGPVGTMDAELFREFWQGFVNEGGFNLHFMMHHGINRHHIIEASFKAAGRAMREAVSGQEGFSGIMSTKGILE